MRNALLLVLVILLSASLTFASDACPLLPHRSRNSPTNMLAGGFSEVNLATDNEARQEVERLAHIAFEVHAQRSNGGERER